MAFHDDPLFVEVSEALDNFTQRYLKRIEKNKQMIKACKIKSVVMSKRAQELKTNAELKARLAELSKKSDDLDRICSNFSSGLTISERDQHRLDNAKEMYEIGKKLTGIRFDFSAPQEVVKGYIKCERGHTLTPFEVPAEQAKDALWTLLVADKENRLTN